MCGGERMCVERAALLVSGLLSAWCAAAALGWARGRRAMPDSRMPYAASVGVRLRRWTACAERWFLLRSLLCGLAVALLGWSALLGQAHLLLMGAMQANATMGAWLACEVHRSETRGAKSPSPPPDGGGAHEPRSCTPRRGSVTLPRGWRYHRSSGLFEHKRTGRMQYDPPGTGETGSPLCNLPPCDEERALLEGGHSDGCSDGTKDSGEESKRAHRSRTYDGNRSVGSRKERSRGTAPMNVWEVRQLIEDGSSRSTSRRASSEDVAGSAPSYSDAV